jgi:hypothetical protein
MRHLSQETRVQCRRVAAAGVCVFCLCAREEEEERERERERERGAHTHTCSSNTCNGAHDKCTFRSSALNTTTSSASTRKGGSPPNNHLLSAACSIYTVLDVPINGGRGGMSRSRGGAASPALHTHTPSHAGSTHSRMAASQAHEPHELERAARPLPQSPSFGTSSCDGSGGGGGLSRSGGGGGASAGTESSSMHSRGSKKPTVVTAASKGPVVPDSPLREGGGGGGVTLRSPQSLELQR